MAAPRGRRIAIGFMIVWLVLWSAGILVVLFGLGSALFGGNVSRALMMGLWLAVAVLGLRSGISKLRQLLGVEARPLRPVSEQAWRDAEPRPGPPEP